MKKFPPIVDLSVIILVGNEERHIQRCLECLDSLHPREVFVIESQKGDRTHELALSTAASLNWNVASPSSPSPTLFTFFNDWPGLYARQFNWALDNLPVSGSWILRLDADEYLTPDTIEKLRAFLSQPQPLTSASSPCGLTLELKRRFLSGEIRHATNGIRQVRLFRRGKARYADSLMDERLIVEGEIADFSGAFYDDSLMPFDEWRTKHLSYAKREARQALDGTTQDWRKRIYYLPIFAPIRPFAYFCYRYFFRLGFLDGRAGWRWNFWQGFWYRRQVEREIKSLKKGAKS